MYTRLRSLSHDTKKAIHMYIPCSSLNIDQAKLVLETDPTRSETTSEVNPRASQFPSHCLPRVLFVAVSPSSSSEEPEVNKHMFNPQATQHHTIC